MATDTSSPYPTCDNCGRDMTPTYTCNVCIDRLNDHIRSTKAKLAAVLELLEPGSGKFGEVVDEKTVALSLSEWHLLETIHARAKAIVED